MMHMRRIALADQAMSFQLPPTYRVVVGSIRANIHSDQT